MSGEEERGRELSPFAGYSFITKNIPNFSEAISFSPSPAGSMADMSSSIHNSRAEVLNYYTETRTESSILIVTKPVPAKALANEEQTYRVLAQFPAIPTLKPVFFFKSSAKEGQMATVAEPTMVSLETYIRSALEEYKNNGISVESDERLTDVLVFSYRQAVLSFLRINQCAVLNNDPRTRNVGVRTNDGTIIGYDFELNWIPGFYEDDHGNPLPADKKEFIREMRTMLEEITVKDSFGGYDVPGHIAGVVAQRILQDIDTLYEDPLFRTYGWTAEKEQKARDILQLNS